MGSCSGNQHLRRGAVSLYRSAGGEGWLVFCKPYGISVWPVFLPVPAGDDGTVLICILVSSANTPGQTFKEGNMGNIDTRICKQVCNDVIGQILQADREGKKETILYVPVSEKEGNWPFPEGNGIAHSLHEHGLTSVMIETTVVPTMEMNEKYHLGLSH